VLLSVTDPQSDAVAEPVVEREDEAQALVHTEALAVELPVTVREPLGEKVAECDAVPQSVTETLPHAVCEAKLAVPLAVTE
jgi:hypothetical protein